MEPRIQYAKTSEGVNIAYCVAGEGRNLLWVWPPPFSHVQLDWETVSSHIFQPLAKNQRLVWFDWPGTGLSGSRLIRLFHGNDDSCHRNGRCSNRSGKVLTLCSFKRRTDRVDLRGSVA